MNTHISTNSSLSRKEGELQVAVVAGAISLRVFLLYGWQCLKIISFVTVDCGNKSINCVGATPQIFVSKAPS